MLIGVDASRIDTQRLTGTERYSREVIASLIRQGGTHRFRLYTRATERVGASVLEISGAHAHRVEWRPIAVRRLWTHLGLGGVLKSNPPDALFVPAHVLPAGFRGGALSRIRSVVTIHDCGFKYFPSAHPVLQRAYLDWSTRFAVRHASMIIADSQATQRDLAQYYGADPARVRVAYPALMPLASVSDSESERLLGGHGLNGISYAVHIGTQQPRKNLRRLIEAWQMANVPDASLVIAGGGGWGGEDLRAAVAHAGLTGRVHLLGYITDAERSALLKHARAYVFPSLYEGFGFGVLEAQAFGLPVTCSNTSSLPEVAGDAALLFDPQSTSAMATAITQVMTDDAQRAMLRERGHKNLQRFSWNSCAATVLDALTGAGASA